jgi:hypothetical protein
VATVALDFPSWALRYPELEWIGPVLAGIYWAEAGLYLDNTDSSPITDDTPVAGQRALLLGMITAHIAALNSGQQGQTPSASAGRVSQASEGQVNVTLDLTASPGSMQWYAQTRYGLAYWQATASFRHASYIAPPRRCGIWR